MMGTKDIIPVPDNQMPVTLEYVHTERNKLRAITCELKMAEAEVAHYRSEVEKWANIYYDSHIVPERISVLEELLIPEKVVTQYNSLVDEIRNEISSDRESLRKKVIYVGVNAIGVVGAYFTGLPYESIASSCAISAFIVGVMNIYSEKFSKRLLKDPSTLDKLSSLFENLKTQSIELVERVKTRSTWQFPPDEAERLERKVEGTLSVLNGNGFSNDHFNERKARIQVPLQSYQDSCSHLSDLKKTLSTT